MTAYESKDAISASFLNEETIFGDALRRGMKHLNDRLKLEDKFPAELAFQLHDSFGFPIDLSVLVAHERGLTLNVADLEFSE